jgi:hypothetical protein
MSSPSSQPVEVSQPERVETVTLPRPSERPAEKPFRIKLHSGIPG